VCDLEWGAARRGVATHGRVGQDWAIINETSTPAANRFVREMTIFVKNDDGSWRRDDERHDNVLIDTTLVPGLLATHGVEAHVAASFGSEELPTGLRALVGHRPA
jgi:archaellum component FlaG (FlaF/FlaG flagellin family)